MPLYINEKGEFNAGDKQLGEREATTEEIENHVGLTPKKLLYRLNNEWLPKKNLEIGEIFVNDLASGLTLKDAQAYSTELNAEAAEKYVEMKSKINQGLNPFEEV